MRRWLVVVLVALVASACTQGASPGPSAVTLYHGPDQSGTITGTMPPGR